MKIIIITTIFLVAIATLPFYFFFKKEFKEESIINKPAPLITNDEIKEDSLVEEIKKEKEEIDFAKIKWLTYINTKDKFEIKYPSDWSFEESFESGAGTIFRSPNYDPIRSGKVVLGGEIYVSIMLNRNNSEILDFMKGFNDMSRFWPEKYAYKEIESGGYEGIKFPEIKEGDYSQTEVMLKANGRIINFSYMFNQKDENVAKIFDRMVTSMKAY